MIFHRRPVVVISGASGGIGKVVARQFYSWGYHLLLLTSNPTSAAKLYEESLTWSCQGTKGLVCTKGIDLSVPLSKAWWPSERVFAEGCDALVVCHGTAPCIKPALDVSETDWHRVISSDLTGTFRLCVAVAPHLMASGYGGSIILVSSFHALGSYPMRVPYAAAKAGVCGLARAFACEWGKDRIRVNVIAPGQVDNERTRRIADEGGPHIFRNMLERAPTGCMTAPRDIASTVEWLMGNESVTGQTIVIDHGVTASLWHQPYPIKE